MKKEFSEQDLTKLHVLFQFLDYVIRAIATKTSSTMLENCAENIIHKIEALIEL